MKKKNASEILEICFNLVFSGEETIETALARFPEYEKEIRPELEAAVWIYQQREFVNLRPGYLAASRKRLVDQIKEEAQNPLPAEKTIFGWRLPVFRLTFVALIILIGVFALQGGVYAIQASLPGDQLYNIKLAAEDIRISLASDPAAEAKLRIDIADERAREIEALLIQGRFEEVESAFINYTENIAIVSALISNLNGDPREIALAQSLATSISQHNESFLVIVTSRTPGEIPSNIIAVISKSVASNEEITVTMAVLLEELGVELLPTPTSVLLSLPLCKLQLLLSATHLHLPKRLNLQKHLYPVNHPNPVIHLNHSMMTMVK